MQAKHPYCLSILGKPGTGKTYLARTIFSHWSEYGGRCWKDLGGGSYYVPEGKDFSWMDWRQVMSQLKGGDWKLIDSLLSAWILALDDIGADYDTTGLGWAKLDEVLRSRRGWTVLTSNMNYKEIYAQSPRVASWIIRDRNKVVELDTLDYAVRKMKGMV